jgi:hypothetical protein
MVKAKKKRKKKVKEKPSHNMFVKGGLNLLILGGIIGVFYQTLYTLIMVETHIEDVSYTLIINILQELGMLKILLAFIFISFFFLKEKEFFHKHAGTLLIGGAVLSIVAAIFSQYEVVNGLKGQTISLESFAGSTFPQLMIGLSKVYIFVGAAFLGIFFWGHRTARKRASQFFIGGMVTGCAALAALMYSTYEMYNFLITSQGEAARDLIISRAIFPDLLKYTSYVLIAIGILLFSAWYIWNRPVFKKWAGRVLVFGGAGGAFHGFISMSLDSLVIRSDITRVRQSIMDLTPYSTYLKDNILTVETLREFYIKKMIPTYLDSSLWIFIFAAAALFGIYLWTKE